MRIIDGRDGLRALAGHELGTSSWIVIEQSRIDLFADATLDDQWIHIDQERAQASRYGSTVAHGLLTLSLIPHLARQIYTVTGLAMTVNYGFNRVRFPQIVTPGARIRDTATLLSATPTSSGMQVVISHALHIADSDQPACVAEAVSLLVAHD